MEGGGSRKNKPHGQGSYQVVQQVVAVVVVVVVVVQAVQRVVQAVQVEYSVV